MNLFSAHFRQQTPVPLILKLILTGFFCFRAIYCFSQNNSTNEIFKAEMLQKTMLGNWQNYATNNPSLKDIIRKKYAVEAKIAGLQNQRTQFIAQDHFNTYTNTPYVIIDDQGHNRVYPSRAAFDDEIIGGLIKTSLQLNQEIIKQKNSYFAAYSSNFSASAISASPTNLKVKKPEK